ncbi:MAG: ATP-binding protein [Bacteroidota bacterium]|nr:ATP-binding protein [Bacteroidota bacterium]MDX5431530.1 ATP-binding protein [Bacteroidota bacterium]MDX5470251.1 ATP-binding protein [Bacteroidota bacterium]
MIRRKSETELMELLEEFPAVAILGPRQIGKTTLALEIAKNFDPEPHYLDLEDPVDLAKLREPRQYFETHAGRLLILDEIQRVPEMFKVLRGVIDKRRREGQPTGQFLMLGSASLELLKQSSESLAGRIAFKELSVLNVSEMPPDEHTKLWLRGGFPDSLLSKSDASSMRWRVNFITTYLEREVPIFGPRIPAVTLRRLWTMLAHNQGEQVNYSKLAVSLDVSIHTIKRYIELLEDLLLLRTLRPWSGNIKKRLVKSPKIYIRDSGLTHALLGLSTMEEVLGHPIVGSSWEGFALENILSSISSEYTPWFYRTSAGAEIDLVLEKGFQNRIAIEIKRSLSPSVTKGFHLACDDLKVSDRYLIYPGNESYTLPNEVKVISLTDLIAKLNSLA